MIQIFPSCLSEILRQVKILLIKGVFIDIEQISKSPLLHSICNAWISMLNAVKSTQYHITILKD